MKYIVHELAVCESEDIGENTRLAAFSCVQKSVRIGPDCEIGAHALVESGTILGARVVIASGAQIGKRIVLEDDVFVGPNVALASGPFAATKTNAETPSTVVEKGASLGANATVLPGLRIGRSAVVGAGAVVTRSVPENAVVMGNPARVMRYVDSVTSAAAPQRLPSTDGNKEHSVRPSRVAGVALHLLPHVKDPRGDLTAGEFLRGIPFPVKRYFMVFDVPSARIRGEHAHKICQQFLICVRGNCSIVADDGETREEFYMDRPTMGLHLPPMVWGVQYKFSEDAVLLVFASEYYDPDDYLRDYEHFLSWVGRPGGTKHPGLIVDKPGAQNISPLVS